jgi:hypothetical protein
VIRSQIEVAQAWGDLSLWAEVMDAPDWRKA